MRVMMKKKPRVLQYKRYNMLKQSFSTFFCKIGTKIDMMKHLKYIQLSISLSLKFKGPTSIIIFYYVMIILAFCTFNTMVPRCQQKFVFILINKSLN